MIRSIQEAYYLQARNPSDDDLLVDLASSLDLDADQFRADLNAPETQKTLMDDIRSHQRMGVTGFPSLVLEEGGGYRHTQIDYNNADAILQQIQGT